MQNSSTSHSPLLLRHSVPRGENYEKTQTEISVLKAFKTITFLRIMCLGRTETLIRVIHSANPVNDCIVTSFCALKTTNTCRAIRVESFNYCTLNDQHLFSPSSISTLSSVQVMRI